MNIPLVKGIVKLMSNPMVSIPCTSSDFVAKCRKTIPERRLMIDTHNTPIDIGSRLELFVDSFLIDRLNGASMV